MKLKTLALTALMTVVALTATTHAGKYVSVNAGLVHMKPRLSQMSDPANANAFTTLIKKNKMTTQANILFGCEEMHSEKVILGGELSLGTTFGGSDAPVDGDGAGGDPRQLKVRQHWKTGIYGLVGTPLSDKVNLYGRLGLVLSKFNVKSVAALGAPGADDFIRRSSLLWGVEPGVRIKVNLTDSLSADFDVNYAMYKSSTSDYSSTAIANDWGIKMSPRMFGITAGVSYKL